MALAFAHAMMLAQNTPATPAPQEPHGQVLFESHGDAPQADADRAPLHVEPVYQGSDVTDAERAAVAIRAYGLDVHVVLADGSLEVRARVTLRNSGAAPMTLVPLQISSSLHWETASLIEPDGAKALPIAHEMVETDTDHTGYANELVLTLPRPLLPNGEITLELFYAGTARADIQRLLRIGADAPQAKAADWDAIAPDGVRLRGFGNVLWYPVASRAVFLGDGAKLFDAIGAARLAAQSQRVKLRLTVTFPDKAPRTAFFCGEPQAMTSEITGDVATADFPERTAGFRGLDLFTISRPEVMLPEDADAADAASSSDSLLAGSVAAVETDANEADIPRLSDGVSAAAASLEDFFGPKPVTQLTILDQPGQAFEDGALLLAPIDSLASSGGTQALVHSLTHAWITTGQPWIDEGLAQFMALNWTERQRGRPAAVAEMQAMLEPLAIAEPGDDEDAGQPLVRAREEMFYRRKAAAVWWMLRDLAGDKALRAALGKFRMEPQRDASPEVVTSAFEKLLEDESHTDLKWFFNDWVLTDKGLPDLTIVDVTPRPLPAGQGHDSGWLVAVTVRNDGRAGVDVPLVLRSGTFSTTRRLRVTGMSTVTDRIVLQSAPTEILLNDGATPELRSSTHSRLVNIQGK